MMGGDDGNAPSSSVLISGSVCTFHIVCNRWGSSGMQVIVSMLRWWNDIEFPSPSSSIFLPGSSPLGLPCLAWDQPGYVRWCDDGDGDVMNVDRLIMTFGVAHSEMGRIVQRIIRSYWSVCGCICVRISALRLLVNHPDISKFQFFITCICAI